MTQLPSLDQLISLKGKRALITGAAAGIGKAIAYRFGEAGADLELADIDSATLPRATDELSTLGVKVNAHIIFQQRLPIGRPGQPDEVARMALVLASDLASYVHGATIPIDGGFLSA